MPHLILVKHALPEIIPALPANQWHLSEIGRAQCTVLADQLATYAPAALVPSSEPKALETAHLVAQRMHTSVQVVDGIQEHDRSNTPWLGPAEFDSAVAAFFVILLSLCWAVRQPSKPLSALPKLWSR